MKCQTNIRRSRLNRSGFTLVEMLMVIALIGVVGTLVVGNLLDKFQEAKVEATIAQMRQLGTILDEFKLDCGIYPLDEHGLEALLEKPEGFDCRDYSENGYLKSSQLPKDGFGREFDYLTEDGGRTYELISRGADKREGGEGVDADVSSKDL